MVSLLRKGNSSTGVHMLQKYGGGYRIRCSPDTLKRATSVEVKPEYRHLFAGTNEIYHSKIFDDVETGKKELLDFVYQVCGVRCTV